MLCMCFISFVLGSVRKKFMYGVCLVMSFSVLGLSIGVSRFILYGSFFSVLSIGVIVCGGLLSFGYIVCALACAIVSGSAGVIEMLFMGVSCNGSLYFSSLVMVVIY